MLTTANICIVLYNLQNMSHTFSDFIFTAILWKQFRYNCPDFTNEAAEDTGGNRRGQGDVRSLIASFYFLFLFFKKK